LGLRFLVFYVAGNGGGHVQSLILAAVLSIVGFQVFLIGLIADQVSMGRKMTEEILYRTRLRQYGSREVYDPFYHT
jgi:hypothetical protein